VIIKTKVLVLVGILIIAFAAVVAPVMAADTGTATLTGNPPKTLSLTVNGGITDWNLDPTVVQPITDATSVNLTVSSNSPGWVVSVKDAQDGSKPTPGRMVDYNAGSYGTLALGSNLTVGGASGTGYDGTEKTLSVSDQAIVTGASDATAAGTFSNTVLTFKQYVVISDSVLISGHAYRIIVTFTGTTP